MLKVLGDPHLGRKFINGVPLHRRGDREIMQKLDFEQSLLNLNDDVEYHINVGDLFDKTYVSYNTILFAVETYVRASTNRPDVSFIVNRGNHDASRDSDKASAYDVFSACLGGIDNIHILGDDPVKFDGKFTVIPWHPFNSALEVVNNNSETIKGSEFVVGHWDVVEIADEYNRIPASRLKELGVKYAISGHDHNARQIEVDELPISVTGSMQPYSHAEDKDGKLYVTLSPDEVEKDRDRLKNMCVRVRGSLSEPLDCLQLSFTKEEKPEEVKVEYDTFDIGAIFEDAFEEFSVPKELKEKIIDKYNETRAAT